MVEDVLHTLGRRSLRADEEEALRSGGPVPTSLQDHLRVVTVDDGTEPIGLDAFFSLMKAFSAREWQTRPKSDMWLAPRLHWAIRLTRRQAADQGIWSWLANRAHPAYVRWRWGDDDNEAVAANRWAGPAIHKQAFARLWWGAELFRNGPDYTSVELLFENQDFPNSYLHRPFARNRAMAVAMVRSLAQGGESTMATSDQINDVARDLNLWLVPLSVEALTGLEQVQVTAYREWVRETVPTDPDWSDLPEGPKDTMVGTPEYAAACNLVRQICEHVGIEIPEIEIDIPEGEVSEIEVRAEGANNTAGWYADPWGQASLRWYDGNNWTSHVQD